MEELIEQVKALSPEQKIELFEVLYVKGASQTEYLQSDITHILMNANVPGAELIEDSEGMPVCVRSGFHVVGDKFAYVVVLGRDGVDESVRQAERDGVTQQVRAALDSAGHSVRVNEYGHLKVLRG